MGKVARQDEEHGGRDEVRQARVLARLPPEEGGDGGDGPAEAERGRSRGREGEEPSNFWYCRTRRIQSVSRASCSGVGGVGSSSSSSPTTSSCSAS